MKFRIFAVIFLVLNPLVLWAQNVNGTAGSTDLQTQRPAVANFPSRKEVQINWDQQEARDNPSPTKASPAKLEGGTNASGGRISAEALADPKIDYVKEAVERVSPMTAEQTREFADEIYRRAIEMSRVPGGPYKMAGTRIARISFAPGTEPESVSVALGMGALVSFIDRAGSPMVIDGVKGFSDAFAVSVMETDDVKKHGSPTFEIEARRLTGQGNVAVRIAGIATPIILNVNVGKAAVTDGNVQFVLPVLSSNRTILPGDRMEAETGLYVPEMQGFLTGLPPEGAVEVKVSRVGDTSAWMWHNHLFLRTPHTVFSPGWFRRQPSADGTAAYELPLTSVVRLGVDGREIEVILDFPYIPPTAGRSATAPSDK